MLAREGEHAVGDLKALGSGLRAENRRHLIIHHFDISRLELSGQLRHRRPVVDTIQPPRGGDEGLLPFVIFPHRCRVRQLAGQSGDISNVPILRPDPEPARQQKRHGYSAVVESSAAEARVETLVDDPRAALLDRGHNLLPDGGVLPVHLKRVQCRERNRFRLSTDQIDQEIDRLRQS